jgi:riboflavin biosynthesis pyrimidine reductase
LSSDQDRALIGAWREAADALLVGPPTLAAEVYGGGLFPPEARARRTAAGASALPPIITLDRSGRLDVDRALRAEESLELIAYVPPDRGNDDPRVQWVDREDLSLASVLRDVRERFGHRLIVAEPGPKLLSALREAWLLTDLSLTVAPVFADHGRRLEGATGAQSLTAVDVEVVGEVIFVHMVAGHGAGESEPTTVD